MSFCICGARASRFVSLSLSLSDSRKKKGAALFACYFSPVTLTSRRLKTITLQPGNGGLHRNEETKGMKHRARITSTLSQFFKVETSPGVTGVKGELELTFRALLPSILSSSHL